MTTAVTWRTFSLYDEVGPWGISAAEVTAELESEPGPVELRICSPGGNVSDAVAIYNRMRARTWPVRVVVDGLAASAATVICMGATLGELAASDGSLLMVHEPWVGVTGTAEDMRKAAGVLDTAGANLASIYARRTGISADTWREAMAAETWFTADEAAAARLVDYV